MVSTHLGPLMEPHHHGSKLQNLPQLLPLEKKHAILVVYYINLTLHLRKKSNFVTWKKKKSNLLHISVIRARRFSNIIIAIITAPRLFFFLETALFRNLLSEGKLSKNLLSRQLTVWRKPMLFFKSVTYMGPYHIPGAMRRQAQRKCFLLVSAVFRCSYHFHI